MTRLPPVWLARAALVALTVLPYLNSFDLGFVFDSRAIVLEDPRIRQVTAGSVEAIFGQSYWGATLESPLYRPATTLSLLANYAVLGHADRPAGYHAVNLLLHVANVLLVFGIARRLSGVVGASVVVAAVWAVHPLLTEAVTNIVGRADLLAAFGVLGGFYAYLRSAGRPPGAWLALAVAAAALAAFSKESGVVLVGVIALYDLTLRRPAAPPGVLVSRWLLVAAPAAVFLILRARIPTSGAGTAVFVDNPIVEADAWTGTLTALAVAGRYLRLLVWPAGLSPDYSYAQVPLFGGRGSEWLAVAAVALVAAAVLGLGRRRPLAAFSGACAALAFLPASNLVFATGTIMAERLMYLPSAGLIACAAAALPAAAAWKKGATAVAVVVVALLAVATWSRNPVWASELSLWTAAAQASPDSFKAHSSLAEALYQSDPSRATLPLAIASMDRSLAILDGLPDERRPAGPYRQAASYHLEHGDRLRDANRAADAASAYRRSVDLLDRYLALLGEAPASAAGRADAMRMRSAALLRLDGDGGRAVDSAREAIAREPFNAASYRAAAAALVQARRFDEAAVTLTVGVMVTGNQDLRAATMDLYRGGLDVDGCALVVKGPTTILDPSCPIVRRHVCEAAGEAMRLQRSAGRAELAEVIERTVVADFGCR